MGGLPENTLIKLFEQAVEIEYAAAGIYKKFSVLFIHVPEVSAAWERLVSDEMNHARMLLETQKLILEEKLSEPVENRIWKNISEVRTRIQKVMEEKIETLDDAYELAHEVESSEVNSIFEFLMKGWISSKNQKEYVHDVIVEHQNRLYSYKGIFGDKDQRKNIAASGDANSR